MKTWMFYVVSLVLITGMGIIIYFDKPEVPKQLLSIRREYALISEEDETIDISLYLNVFDHDIIDSAKHISAYLSNASSSKKIEVILKNIQKGQRESYLEMIWTEWVFIYELSLFGYDYEIEECYLNLTLESGDEYRILIGKLYISNLDEQTDHLDWHDLSAKKRVDSLFSRIDQIDIGYISLDVPIEKVSVGTGIECTFEIDEQSIKINIPDDHYLLNRVPIILSFEDGSVQLIQNFTYFIEHQLLKESGMLVTTYALH